MHEHANHSHEQLAGPETQRALMQRLSEHRLFAEDAPITRFVAERVAYLCGDEYPMPQVVVRDADEPNACIIGDVMVVDTGIFKVADHEEEFYGVLAHELVHHHKKHAAKHREANPNSVLESVGIVRVHELEGDLGGMLLVDKRGINPRGVPSFFQKLAAYRGTRDARVLADLSPPPEEESTRKPEPSRAPIIDSPTHGKTIERSVNTEQTALFLDMPNLSPLPLTPLALPDKAQFGDHDSSAEGASLMRRQAALTYRMKAAQERRTFNDQLSYFVATQAALLNEADPSLDPPQAQQLAELAVWAYRSERSSKVKNLILYPAAEHPYEPGLAGGAQLLKNMQHPTLLNLVGALPDMAAEKLHEAFLQATFMSESSPEDKVAAIDMIDPTRTAYAVTKALGNAMRQATQPDKLEELVAVFMQTRCSVYSTVMATNKPLLNKRLIALRIAGAEQVTDDLDFMAHLTSLKVHESVVSEDPMKDYDFSHWDSHGGLLMTRATTEEEYLEAADRIRLGKSAEEYNSTYLRLLLICEATEPLAFVRQLAASNLPADTKAEVVRLWQIAVRQTDTMRQHRDLPLSFTLTDFITGDTESLNESFASYLTGWTDRFLHAKVRAVIKRQEEPDEQQKKSGRQTNLEFASHLAAVEREAVLQISQIELTDEQRLYLENLSQKLGAESAVVNDLQTAAALETFAFEGSAEPLLAILAHHAPARLRAGGAFIDEELHKYAAFCWQRAAQNFLRNPENLTTETGLRTLIALGICAEDVEVNLAVPGGALARLVELYDFEAGKNLVFNDFAHLPGYILRPAADVLIESKATTEHDFVRLEEVMMNRLEAFVEGNAEEIGIASVLETNLIDAYQTSRTWHRETGLKKDVIHNMEAVRLLRALLMSAQSDQELTEYVFERWWAANRTQIENRDSARLSAFRVEDIVIYRHSHKTPQRKWWVDQLPPPGDYHPLTEILENLYLSNDAAHFLLVRKLMLGDGGVLTDHEGREALTQAFLESWLQYEEGSSTHHMLYNLLSSLMESETPARLYQYIGPVFQELMLHPPQSTSSSPIDIAKRKAAEVVQDLLDRRKITSALVGNEETAVAQKILNLIRGSTAPLAPSPAAETLRQLRGLFGGGERGEFKLISPVELALIVGEKSGALGIRMLQLAGQYYDIPNDKRERFNQVYDSLKGQTRLQAMRVLRREAGHSPELRALMNNVASYGERLGGGSLMTVYDVTTKDGSKAVIGVRNPNAEYHVIRIAELAQRALTGAAARTPDNTDLLMAQSLLVDAVEWIRAELNDAEFGEKDAVFRQENDTRRGNGFDKGNAKYDVIVPQPQPTGSLLVRWEQQIAGTNLNNIQIVEDEPTNLPAKQMSRGDYRDAVSVLVRNFLHQINNGHYVHPDVHMGNFRITEDNTAIAVFDRYNLIPVTGELRATLQQTITSLAVGDRRSAVTRIIQTAVSGEQEATPEHIAELADTIAGQIEGEADLTKTMASTVIELKKAGVRIPVHLSLILRNIFSLAQLSERAGFGSLVLAFLHTATESEVRDIAGDFM